MVEARTIPTTDLAAAPPPIRVRLFARLAELTGVRSIDLIFVEDLTVHAAYLHLCHRYPGLLAYDGKLMYAVNAEYQDPDRLLRPGDELTLVPPVSGGAARS